MYTQYRESIAKSFKEDYKILCFIRNSVIGRNSKKQILFLALVTAKMEKK